MLTPSSHISFRPLHEDDLTSVLYDPDAQVVFLYETTSSPASVGAPLSMYGAVLHSYIPISDKKGCLERFQTRWSRLYNDAVNRPLDPVFPRGLSNGASFAIQWRADEICTNLSGEPGNATVEDAIKQYFRTIVNQNRDFKALECSKLSIEGTQYQPVSLSPRNSTVIFRDPMSGTILAGRIETIFLHHRRTSPKAPTRVEDAFLLVTTFQELDDRYALHDPYRRFKIGGKLYRNASATNVVIRPWNLICHGTLTSMTVPNIGHACIHILPLDRLAKSSRGLVNNGRSGV